MSETIRTFIAVDLNLNIKKTIEGIQSHFKKLDCNIKWVSTDNIHLTLKFLGNVNAKEIESVKQALEGLSKKTKPIQTKLTELGAFPNIHSPKIFWVGLKDVHQEIAQLEKSTQNTLRKIGFKKDSKSFHPHITIGRIRTPRNINMLTQAITNYPSLPAQVQNIQKISLYKSTLASPNPIYEQLANFDLHNS